MRCASVLLDAQNLDLGTDNNHGRSRLTDAEVYDDPRGLGKLPIRRDFDIKSDSGGDNEKNGKEVLHGDDWRLHDSDESIAIMRGESVKRKMLEKDGEMFFSVVTKG